MQISPKLVYGRVRGSLVKPDGTLVHVTEFSPNLLMYDWATIVCKLLQGAPDGKPYKIGGMYLEFANSATPAAAPGYDRSGGKSYYDSLLTHPTNDYLRVPLTSATVLSTDDEVFPRGNEITFYAQSQGVVGAHGKTFSDSSDSRVVGAALVTYPQFSDQTQDLIFSRFYFPEDNQIPKPAGHNVGITWPLALQ